MTDSTAIVQKQSDVQSVPPGEIVSIEYGATSAVSRWMNDYLTQRDRLLIPWLLILILGATLLLGPRFFLMLASMLPVDRLGNSGASIRAHVFIQAIAAVLFGGAIIALVKRLARPGLIQVSPRGVRKVWLVFGLIPVAGPYLAWNAVKSANLTKSASSTDPNDWKLTLAGENNAAKLRLPLREIESPAGRQVLLDALCKWVPNVDANAIEALSPIQKLSFTEVWLSALSAPPGREKLLPLAANTLLDARYKVTKQLGAGGQGTVYLAEDTTDSTNVVLKETILPVYADLIARKKALEEFHKEAAALDSVRHQNIVRFRGTFVADHRAYLILDFVPGTTMSERVKNQGPVSADRAIRLATKMCEILNALHSTTPPLIHRDFTPDNLIVSDDDNIVLIDFAVAVTSDRNSSDVAGKASYMAPEQFKGKPTTLSDIYSLGCVMHFMLTGEHPEPLGEAHPIIANSDVPKPLSDLVATCTKQAASERYQSANVLKEALQAIEP